MKVRVTFKDPDALIDCTEGEKKALKKWIEYEECITIDFDTVEKTAKVVERKCSPVWNKHEYQ